MYAEEEARVRHDFNELVLLVASTQQAAEDVAASLQESASRARQYDSAASGALSASPLFLLCSVKIHPFVQTPSQPR